MQFRIVIVVFTTLFITAFSHAQKPTQIAFLADIHFHDVYGSLGENAPNIATDTLEGTQRANIRSMSAQLHSTRLFNETYFVLLAALDDLAKKGIKLVALPGDFSDDGQPVHIRGLTKILEHYRQQHGMRFFAIPGNHDPVRPFTTESGKNDFLQADGSEVAVYSSDHERCKTIEQNTVCTDLIKKWGYKEIVTEMANFGFYPTAQDLYFETPFPAANRNRFDFTQRSFSWCGSDKQCINMPDTSYVVEPVEGLWLLAIDANVYAPKDSRKLTQRGEDYNGSSSAGYNALLTYKPELITWIKDVVQRAKQQNKQLIAFSHFPMTDFYDKAAPEMEQLFGKGKQQLKRLPTQHTAQSLADTGLTLHIGGHMHINDTGSITSSNGNTLYNIQAPTLGAYKPGYKVLTLHSMREIEVETVVLDDVPRFSELFPHYLRERHHLVINAPEKAWPLSILKVKNYGEFTDEHLKALVDNRHIPKDWPAPLITLLRANNPQNILTQHSCKLDALKTAAGKEFNAMHWVYDFYRLRNADSLANVSEARRRFYTAFAKSLTQCEPNTAAEQQLKLMMAIMAKQIRSEANDNFTIILNGT